MDGMMVVGVECGQWGGMGAVGWNEGSRVE